jgi:Type II secretion system (T2SS), protein E, N-terminal domain
VASFAAFLVGSDYMSAAELEEVTQATVLYGGRLGTAVVEAGLMTPEELDRALAQHHDLPEIPAEWLRKPDPAARAAIHIDLVKRHKAFPLHFEKRTLHVGLLDPRDASVLDALAFASGCLIAPYPLSELRLTELMQRIHGVAPSPRFAALLDAGHLARVQRGRAALRETRRLEQEAGPQELVLGPLAADLELSDEATFEAMSSRPPLEPAAWEPPPELALPFAPSPAPPAPPREAAGRAPQATAAEALRRAEEALCAATRRDAVIDAALALAGSFAELAALFVVRDGVAAGLRALRAGESFEIDSIVAPLGGDGLFADAVRGGKPLQRPPTAALDKVVVKALRCEGAGALAVFPIAIGGRVVNLLVARSGASTLPATAAAALGVLAQLVSASYERLILNFKQQSTAAS